MTASPRSCTSWARTASATQGLSDVGAVVAATEPALLAALRERMPQAVLLLPGVGAQGGRVEDLAPAFAGRPAAALVTVSRSIARAALDAGDAAAARPVAEQLRAATWAVCHRLDDLPATARITAAERLRTAVAPVSSRPGMSAHQQSP